MTLQMTKNATIRILDQNHDYNHNHNHNHQNHEIIIIKTMISCLANFITFIIHMDKYCRAGRLKHCSVSDFRELQRPGRSRSRFPHYSASLGT